MAVNAAFMLRMACVQMSGTSVACAISLAVLSLVIFKTGSRRQAELVMDRNCTPAVVPVLAVAVSIVGAAASCVATFVFP